MKIEIKNVFGKVLFEYDKENNTIKDTVVKAVEEGVNLSNADLRGANLSYANLRNADLRYADLYGADLNGADLRGASLYDANLRHADLINADLSYANLRYAKLSYANLEDVDLTNANLYGANLVGAKNTPSMPLVCPSEGSFIGWKKISDYKEDYRGNYIVKLLIPEDAKRSSATSNKCRCDKAKVLEITNIFTNENVDVITNTNYRQCVYKVGEYVYPDSFDEDRWNECSNGIHFFIEIEDAINY